MEAKIVLSDSVEKKVRCRMTETPKAGFTVLTQGIF